MSSSNLRSTIDLASAVADRAWDGALVSIGDSIRIYNESALRYFLAIERERSTRSGRSLLLLLIDIPADGGVHKTPIEPSVATSIFGALSHCLRETDFIGWYERGLTAGAVLTQRSDNPSSEAAPRVRDRLLRVLRKQLPRSIGQRLHVRLYRMPVGLKGRQSAWR